MAKILYISCHSVLEYDELKLLTSLGHEVFSIGSYINPSSPSQTIRPPIKLIQDPDLINFFYKYNLNNGEFNYSKEFLDYFDIIISMHMVEPLEVNISKIDKNKQIYWRGIGQSNSNIESRLKKLKNSGVKLIRYSPLEKKTPNFAGEDFLIRFYKSEKDFIKTNHKEKFGAIFYNSLVERSPFNDWVQSKEFIQSYDFHIFGGNNDTLKNSFGYKTYEEQMDIYSKYSSIFCIASYPAPYTLGFIEAVLSGNKIFINKHNCYFDERFLFKQDYINVTNNIYSFIPNSYIKNIFSEETAKKEWFKLLK